MIPFSIEKQVSQFDHQSPCEIICKDLKKIVQLGTVWMKKSDNCHVFPLFWETQFFYRLCGNLLERPEPDLNFLFVWFWRG